LYVGVAWGRKGCVRDFLLDVEDVPIKEFLKLGTNRHRLAVWLDERCDGGDFPVVLKEEE
jgi:hypothetical protein